MRLAQIRKRQADQATTPLSYAQESLWFLEQLGVDGAAYTVRVALCLEGPLDDEILCKSLDALLQRHEILRTRLAVREGMPTQIVDACKNVSIEVLDLREIADNDRK